MKRHWTHYEIVTLIDNRVTELRVNLEKAKKTVEKSLLSL